MNFASELIKRHHAFLIFLCATACLLRALFFIYLLKNNACVISFDSGHYHNAAVQIARGKGLSNADGSPHFYRLPGYPLFLAACYKIFGQNPLRAIAAQIVVGSVIPLLVFLLVLQLFPAGLLYAYGAGIITALHPGFLILSGLIMTETLFIFFFLLFLILFFRLIFIKPENIYATASYAGIFLGLASLIRPVGLPILLLSCAIIFYIIPRWRRKFMLAAIMTSSWLMFVCMLFLRNFLLTGLIFFHTFTGPHLLNHGAIRVVMDAEHVTYDFARRQVYDRYESLLIQVGLGKLESVKEPVRAQVAHDLALDIFQKNRWSTAKILLINCIKTTFALYSSELLFVDSCGSLPPYQIVRSVKDIILRFLLPTVNNPAIIFVIYGEVIMSFVLIVGFLGFCYQALWHHNFRRQVGVSLLFIMLFVLLSAICGFARLRLPIEPLIIMGATMFLIDWYRGKYA